MNMLLQLQTLLTLALVLLISLLPLHQTHAQEKEKTERSTRVKIISNENGKMIVIDTTLTGASATDIARALQAAKLDTAQLRLLNKQFKAYSLERGELDNVRIRALRADSAMAHRLQGARVLSIQADSMLKSMKRFNIVHGDSLLAGKAPRVYIRAIPDSSFVYFGKADQELTFNPKDIERIVVRSLPSPARIDSLLKLEGKAHYKILVEGGKKKVYRIHDDGREEEVEHTGFELGTEKISRAIFIMHKAVVETPTTADKEQLKATGAPVEMKAREELKVEEISYYPNPNNGRFNLKFSLKNKGTTVVRVMDAQGREVFVDTVEKLTGAYEREIDLTPFGRGMFFLQVAQGGRYHTKKIVVQ